MKNVITDISQLLTARSAARVCGITRRRFYAAVAEGRAPQPILVDGQHFYLQSAVEAWDRNRKKRKTTGERDGVSAHRPG